MPAKLTADKLLRPADKVTGKERPEVQRHRTSLTGTRLAAHLHEIINGLGQQDPHLKALAEAGLRRAEPHQIPAAPKGDLVGGTGKAADVYTAIRDRLLAHSGVARPLTDPKTADRARELVTTYNWHRVGDQLHVQDAVAGYVEKAAKEHIKCKHFRAAHQLFGKAPGTTNSAPSPMHEAFWEGLRSHVRAAVGGASGIKVDSSLLGDNHLRNALYRLSEAEGNREQLAARGKRQLKDTLGGKNPKGAESIDYLTWLPGEKSGWTGSGDKIRTRADRELSPEQYAKQNLNDFNPERGAEAAKPKAVDLEAHREDGLLHRIRHNGQVDSDKRVLAGYELAGLNHAMHAVGLIGPKEDAGQRVREYAGEIRDYMEKHPTDMLTRHYGNTAVKLATPEELPKARERKSLGKKLMERIAPPVGETTGKTKFVADPAPVGMLDLSKAVAPLVRYLGVKRGELKARPPTKSTFVPPLPPEPTPDWEEVDPSKEPQLPQTEAERNEFAANLLKSMDAPKRVQAELVPEHAFGSAGALDLAEVHPHEADLHFDLPHFEGGDDVVKEVEAHPTVLTAAEQLALADRHLERKTAKGLRSLKLRNTPAPKTRAKAPDAPLAMPVGNSPAEQVEAAYRSRVAPEDKLKVPRSRKKPAPLPKPKTGTSLLPSAGSEPINFARALEIAYRARVQ